MTIRKLPNKVTIDDQEQNKEGNLYLRVVYKTTKNKFSHLGVIFTDHILEQSLSNNQSICVKGSNNILEMYI